MIAAATDVVPDLWENAGDWVPWVESDGQLCRTGASVFASWRRESSKQMPHVHLAFSDGPFSLGLSLLPGQARDLAAQLVRAAELAEATQAALDAERAQEQ